MGTAMCGAATEQSEAFLGRQLVLNFDVLTDPRHWDRRVPQAAAPSGQLAAARANPRVSQITTRRLAKGCKWDQDRYEVDVPQWLDESHIEAMSVTGGDWDLVGSEVPVFGDMLGESCSPVIDRNFVSARLLQLGAL